MDTDGADFNRVHRCPFVVLWFGEHDLLEVYPETALRVGRGVPAEPRLTEDGSPYPERETQAGGFQGP